MSYTRLDPPLTFTTERLEMSRQNTGDLIDLFKSARDSKAELSPFLPWCHEDYSIGDSQAWIESVKPAWENNASWSFGIRDRTSNEYLGGCSISKIDEHPIGNLGYWIKSSVTGSGYATEATIGLAKYALDCLRLIRVEIIMSTQNKPSKVVAEKSGAVFEGILRNRLMLHGECHDAYSFSITPGDLT